MNYRTNHVRVARKNLKPPILRGNEDIPKFDVGYDIIEIVLDEEYVTGMLDEIHKRKYRIENLGLTPKFLLVNERTYKQLLLYNYNLTNSVESETICGLTPLVSDIIQDYQVDIQCKAYDEFMYREELSHIRYGGNHVNT